MSSSEMPFLMTKLAMGHSSNFDSCTEWLIQKFIVQRCVYWMINSKVYCSNVVFFHYWLFWFSNSCSFCTDKQKNLIWLDYLRGTYVMFFNVLGEQIINSD